MFLINNPVLEMKLQGEKNPILERKGNLAIEVHK